MQDLPQLETGDLIRTHGTSIMSRLIQWVQNSYWNHGLFIDEPIADDYAMVESIAKGPAIGLFKKRYAKEIERGDISIHRYYRPLSSEEKERLRYRARAFQQHRYDHCLAFRIIDKLGVIGAIKVVFQLRAGKDVKIPHIKDISIVCTELYQEIFAGAELLIWPTGLLFLPRSAPRSEELVEVFNPHCRL